MKKTRILLLFLISALLLKVSVASAEEQNLEKIDTKQQKTDISQSLDLEKFKKELTQASASTPETNQNVIKGSVKTLNTKYLIAPGDSLTISVYGEPDFSQQDILVRPDGNITVEPFGEINVAGLSIDDLTDNLKTKLKSYLLDPKVSVKLNNTDMAKVYVYGAIYKPGLYQQTRVVNNDATTGRQIIITPELTVASVIANSGGIKSNADLRHVRITNNSTTKAEVVDLMRLIKDGDASQDIYLRSGDSIYIPYLDSDAQNIR